jgi:hypothetical protein
MRIGILGSGLMGSKLGTLFARTGGRKGHALLVCRSAIRL